MITKRETRLSQIMIAGQVAFTMLLFLVVEEFFPIRVFNLKEKTAFLLQIGLIWSYLFYKFRLGIIFRANTFGSMVRGYLVTIFFGSALFFLELESLHFRHYIPYSLKYMVLFACFDLVSLIILKVVFYYFMKFLRRKGYNRRHIIIVGDLVAIPFIDSFINAKDWGYQIKAIISPDVSLKGKYEKLHIIKAHETLKKFITQHTVDDIFYCIPIDDNRYNLELLIKDSEEIGVSLHIMQHDYIHNRPHDSKFNQKFDHSFVTYQTVPPKYLSLKIKDAFDMVFSVVALLLMLPVLFLIAFLIKLEDGGPVFFKQERIGLNGRRFNCYKFKSMILGADELIAQLQELNESDGPTFKIENDPRITKIGRIIRKTSFDELPQFYNVIKGEMSVVGPRPPLLREVKQYERSQLRRLSMKPGITCKWQVWGRNQVTFKEWMQMDLDYIDNWSIWLDVKIMLATIGVIIKANGQ
jgi:exopolysaccharide biosynthesis polyprenyl glycosylphosphotransferase